MLGARCRLARLLVALAPRFIFFAAASEEVAVAVEGIARFTVRCG